MKTLKYGIIFIFAVSLYSQNYNSEHYSYLNTGLPGNCVECLLFDGNANIWFGVNYSGNGDPALVKFGNDIYTVYNVNNSEIPNDGIFSIAEDVDHSIWVGTASMFYRYALAHYSNSQWEIYNSSNSILPDYVVSDIEIDQSGNKYFAVGNIYRGYGFYEFDGLNWTKFDTTNSPLPTNNISSLAHDRQYLWIGLRADDEGEIEGGGLVRYDGVDWVVYNTENSAIPSNNVEKVYIDDSNQLWIGTHGGGIAKFDGTHWTRFIDMVPDMAYYKFDNIAMDQNGILWTNIFFFDGTNWELIRSLNMDVYGINDIKIDEYNKKYFAYWDGVFVYNDTSWATLHMDNTGMPNCTISSIFLDKNQDVWLGMGRHLCYYDGLRWKMFNLQGATVIDITQDKKGEYWIGAQQGLFSCYKDTLREYHSSNIDFSNQTILATAVDSLYRIWVGSYGFIANYNGTDWQIFNASNSNIKPKYVHQIMTGKEGDVWAIINMNEKACLAEYDGSDWTVYDPNTRSVPTTNFIEMAEDSYGVKWLCADSGLVKFDGVNWNLYEDTRTKLSNDLFQTIVIDSKDNKWIGCRDSGLVKFSNNNFEYFKTDNSALFLNNINKLAIDKNDNMWIVHGWGQHKVGDHFISKLNENFTSEISNISENKDCQDCSLYPNYPNPFNSTTKIHYRLLENSKIKMSVYNVLGEEVIKLVDSEQSPGYYEIQWDSQNVTSGCYIIILNTEYKRYSQKMLIIK